MTSFWRLAGMALLSSLGAFQAAAVDSARLVILVQGVQGGEGALRASLYGSAESFRKEAQALQVRTQPASDRAELVFEGLAPGRYAVMVYHDANGDQKLNLRFGMFPTEGYGLSNNPKVMGPPRFDDSAFDCQAPETRIHVQLAY